MKLKIGDIVPVQFGSCGSTKTLALIERIGAGVYDDPLFFRGVYDVTYNDGTRGTGCSPEIFGDPIAPDDVVALFRHTFRHLDSRELFKYLIDLREAATKHMIPPRYGVTTGPY